jgi:MFS superfamily sulfate permease-like transporter
MSLDRAIGRDHLRYDAGAGLVVFLVALPLCLGIALASGAPLVGGLVAGVVGGAVVGALSGSPVSVSGPAAGLTVIVAAAIQNLGSYEAFLVAVALSGVIQVGFAALRLGVVADYIPTTVIKGMLAAIGIVIVLKQIPHALGRDTDWEGDLSFLEPGGHENTLSAIAKALLSASPGAVLISLGSLALLLAWDKLVLPKIPRARLLPGPLLVVLLGVALNELFRAAAPGLALQGADGHLVALPSSLEELTRETSIPAFGALRDTRVYTTALTLAIVGSIESLLSLEAAQKLDPWKRYASPTRELFAQGAGNLLSGLLGGLPVTAVIVRTSANVYAGGRTRWSAVFHALLLGGAVIVLPSVLNRIPLAALAAVLIVVGMKLSPPGLYRAMWREGWGSFTPFVVTVLAIVLTDLLKGVLVGVAVGVFFVMRANHHAAMTMVNEGTDYLIRFNKDLVFINKAELKARLARVPDGGSVVIDATRALYVDRDVFDVIDDYVATARHRDIRVELKNFQGKRPDSKE